MEFVGNDVSWTTALWCMVAAACVTTAVVHLALWWRDRTVKVALFFSTLCIATAAVAACELWMMHARTPLEFATAVLWMHVPVWVVVASLVGLVRVHLGHGTAWLGWAAIAARTLSLIANFTTGANANYLEVTSLQRVEFLGERVSVAVGIPNPWMALGQLSLWLCVLFVATASLDAWRRGSRRKVLSLGVGLIALLAASSVQSTLVVWGNLRSPTTFSMFFLPIIVVIAFELSRNMLHAKELATELGESEQRMMQAAGAVNLGIWSRDLLRDETWVNSQWRQLLGFTPTETINVKRALAKVHPEDRDRVQQVMEDTTAVPGVHHSEFRVLLANGDVRWISAAAQAEFDSTGHPVRTRGASMDCTARKTSEQELLLLRQEIAHVGRITTMGQLASALAHEINQPLGAILRNAEAATLLLQEPSPDLEELDAILQDILKDDQRAGAVIDRMRALLRRQDVQMRRLAVDELFSEVASLVRPEAVARRVKLKLQVDRNVPHVAGDRIHLQQVLLNLVSNGMDAIDQASGASRCISVSAHHDGGERVEIAVSDSGRGIPADQLARLFEPFFTTKPRGMGMGLSISRTIIEAHGGRLWAENGRVGGARFLFTVPAA